MPMVRLLDHGQITIPKRFWEALGLKKGDVAEAELEGERIVFTPKKLVRQKVWQRLSALLDEVHQQNKGVSEKRVARDVLEAIAELREEEYVETTKAKSRSR